MALLRMRPKDCSPLGKEVLRYMKQHNISLREFARLAGITHPSLRVHCLGQGNPTETTLRKLARVLEIHPVQLYLLAYGDKIKALDDEPSSGLFAELFETVDKIIGRTQQGTTSL